MKKAFIIIILLIFNWQQSLAQCAMCRTTLENNFSNGNPGIAAGINFGILYLFVAPYLAVALIAYFWYRTSRTNAQKELAKRAAFR
ncbi:MAG: hypothetical protein HC811_11660 [Flammeovirgaceae bacterium]|nr:hypothetical protein [Flammeovirgaceae bacterium]